MMSHKLEDVIGCHPCLFTSDFKDYCPNHRPFIKRQTCIPHIPVSVVLLCCSFNWTVEGATVM